VAAAVTCDDDSVAAAVWPLRTGMYGAADAGTSTTGSTG
jgi:hypothetical protein